MIRIEDIIERVQTYNPQADEGFLRKAYLYSAKAHKGQKRSSGEPYLSHPMEVANLLAEMHSDSVAVASGMLHDVVEDTFATTEDLETMFGESVAHIVEGVTKIGQLSKHANKETTQAATFRKMILAMTDDIRVILVKLADRLHNMRTLDFLKPEKRRRISQETLNVYAPIAHRLGMGRIKHELEELAFKHAEPEIHDSIEKALDEKRSYSEDYIKKARKALTEVLKEVGVKGEIWGRTKHFYSIYRKMQAQSIPIEEVYDYIAFRIVVDNVADCYSVLGAIHGRWKPIPGRIKDYIAIPKPNGYQSLHTSVLGQSGNPFEVQIRTREMHELAEEGIAAHWRYKEGKLVEEEDDKRTQWLRHLLEMHQETGDHAEFYESVKGDLAPETIYVFTPQSDVKALPRGATALDFAYAIHTDVGTHCNGAKVNGRLVPLRTELTTGDIVEVMTSPNQQPRRDWLKFVISHRAKSKIRHSLNQREKERAVEMGSDMLDVELKRLGIAKKKLTDKALAPQLQAMGFPDRASLFAAIGFGKVLPVPLLKRVFEIKDDTPAPVKKKTAPAAKPTALVVDGVDDIMTQLARCCRPIHGDEVVGFVTRGKGVTVHKTTCANVAHLGRDHARMIPVTWSEKAPDTARFEAKINIATEDRKGILADITMAISGLDTNIVHFKAKTTPGARGHMEVVLSVRDVAHLEQLCRQIRSVGGIISVDRMR